MKIASLPLLKRVRAQQPERIQRIDVIYTGVADDRHARPSQQFSIMQSWSMAAASPRDRVLGNIIAIVSISVLTSFFFMQGVVNAVRGERLLTWLFFLCLPFFAFAIVVLARRILREIR